MHPTLTEAIERVELADANVRSMFDDVAGEQRLGGRRGDPAYEEEFIRAGQFYEAVVRGRRPEHHLSEALTTSDFPLLLGDLLSRTLLAGYREQTYIWQNIADRRTLRDLREIRLVTVDGGAGRLERVRARTEYPESSIVEGEHTIKAFKHGRAFDISLEMLINDYLGVFDTNGTLQRFGRGARRTEEFLVTDLFVGTAGPDAGLYTVGNGNIVTGNPALSRSALQAALTQLRTTFTDEDGEPVIVDAVELVIPPALENTAREILDATEYRIDDGGNTRIIRGNGVAANLRINVDYYIPTIADTNGDTSWFLFASPANQRPALAVAFLRGYEDPQMFMKTPDARRIGGGGGEDLVDFETDSRRYKVRHFVGGAIIDPKGTVASNGSGA